MGKLLKPGKKFQKFQTRVTITVTALWIPVISFDRFVVSSYFPFSQDESLWRVILEFLVAVLLFNVLAPKQWKLNTPHKFEE